MNTLTHPEVRLDSLGRPRRILRGSRNQCPGCNHFFNSERAFERHRKNGACLTLDEMQARGFSVNADGFIISKVRDP